MEAHTAQSKDKSLRPLGFTPGPFLQSFGFSDDTAPEGRGEVFFVASQLPRSWGTEMRGGLRALASLNSSPGATGSEEL